ncbi:biotin-independent malonate decarboxylase subunit beta, partial [Burkholderia pseudomallei]
RQRLAGLVDAVSLDEFAGAPARLPSPPLPMINVPQQFDDVMIVGRATHAGEPVVVAPEDGRYVRGEFGLVAGGKLSGQLG